MGNRILPYNPALKTLARVLRKNSTLSEVLLWNVIKGKKLGFEFHRQVPILDFVVDFYCHELQLAIEVDGSSHDNPKAFELDSKRQQDIEKLGVSFIRIDDQEIKKNLAKVIEYLTHELHPY